MKNKNNYEGGLELSTREGKFSAIVSTPPPKSQRLPKAIEDNEENLFSSEEIHFWGQNNRRPNDVVEMINKSSIIPSAIEMKVNLLIAAGIEYGVKEADEGGKVTFKRIIDPEIEQFLEKASITEYAKNAARDYYTFGTFFPFLVLNKNRTKILTLSSEDCLNVRFAKQDKDGFIRSVFFDGSFSNDFTGSTLSEEAQKIRLLDPIYDSVEDVKQRTEKRYCLRILHRSPGKSIYPVPPWHSILSDGGWLEFVNSIPVYKSAIMRNQAFLNFLLRASDKYWNTKFPDWKKLSPERRKEERKKVTDLFDSMLSGADNAGKTMLVTDLYDEIKRENLHVFEIEKIGSSIKDGAYVEDSEEGSSQILFALGIAPALFGSSPSGGMGAGSGSDVRELLRLFLYRSLPDHNTILKPFLFIKQFNGWEAKYPNLTFRFKQPSILNQSEITPSERSLI